jgi:hypothetical protein
MNKKILAVLVLAAVLSSGCVDSLEDQDTGGQAVDFVPEGVDAVVQVNTTVLQDETTRRLANGVIETTIDQQGDAYEGPESYDEVWTEFENETDLDPTGLEEVAFFTTLPDEMASPSTEERYAAAVVRATWGEEELLDIIKENATVESGEYNGMPFYTVEPDAEFSTEYYVASLGGDVYSFGAEEPVRDSVDVSAGDADSLSGDLRAELERVSDGYITFAMTPPSYDVFNSTEEDSPMGPGSALNMGAFNEISVVSGAYDSGGDTLRTEFNVRANTEGDARDIQEATEGMKSIASQRSPSEGVDSLLESVEVDRDGATVLVTYETTVEELLESLETTQEDLTSGTETSSSMSVPTSEAGRVQAPQAGVSVDIDGGTNEATITVVDPGNVDRLTAETDVAGDSNTVEPVEAGESATLSVAPDGDTVTVTGTTNDTTSVLYQRSYGE